MEIKQLPIQIRRRAQVLDDLKLLVNSLPAEVRAQVVRDIKLVLAEVEAVNQQRRSAIVAVAT